MTQIGKALIHYYQYLSKRKDIGQIIETRSLRNDVVKHSRFISTYDLMYTAEGGENWLSTARSWIQTTFQNGSEVNWGSQDLLKGKQYFTVRDIEMLAARVAAAAINEERQRLGLVPTLVAQLEDPVRAGSFSESTSTVNKE